VGKPGTTPEVKAEAKWMKRCRFLADGREGRYVRFPMPNHPRTSGSL
jgi:hypothetical protein